MERISRKKSGKGEEKAHWRIDGGRLNYNFKRGIQSIVFIMYTRSCHISSATHFTFVGLKAK